MVLLIDERPKITETCGRSIFNGEVIASSIGPWTGGHVR